MNPYTKEAAKAHAIAMLNVRNELFGLEQGLREALLHFGVKQTDVDIYVTLARNRQLNVLTNALDISYPQEK